MDLPPPDRASFVDLDRTRLRLWEWGDPDDPPVLCLHGAFDHGRMWDEVAPQLAALGNRVVAPDLRGHGDSGRLSSGNVWEASAIDLALLARHLGPPVGIVGHSFGGGQALTVAGVWPELVRWVVNLDGVGPPAAMFEEERDLVELTTGGLAMAERVLARRPRVYGSLADMADRRAGVNGRLPRPWVDHLVRHGAVEIEGGFVWKADPLFSVGFADAFSVDHLHAQYEQISGDVLVLTGGEHDTWSELSPDELAARIGHIPRARHQVIEGAGHYVHIEQPTAVVAAIAAFVGEVGP